MNYSVTYKDVEAAAVRLKDKAIKTPVFTSRTANELTKAQFYFKCENYQHVGAFKFRGAFNAIACLTAEQRRAGVITYSSGNHAQAIAYASKLHNSRALIIMPKDAPEIKMAATKGYGAEIYLYDRYTEDREIIAQQLSKEHGLTLIPPYDHPDVIAGQGTAAKELIEEVGALDYLFVPLGGGGLLSGSLLAAKYLLPNIKVFGVEPEAGNDGQQSLRKGEIIHITAPKTIADGAATTHLGQHTFPIIQNLVDDILTVSDQELVSMMPFFAERMKMIVEPTGCLAAAAAMKNNVPIEGKKIGVILSGGNVDLKQFAKWVG
ncbi:Threonine deaminase (IlvA) (PDB:3IAU) [Commensalibacter communis]|uniref:Threonine deaminase (IlvA) n=1 Tax=Commensalibacter communis TaxID=2972786 RepID=A0A9W4TQY5_9PROT|nr:threo-3-hydroxy-L-aspartate ammonia-lyase [Commensalibacter communis]CAI3938847.1 Threonine deaminase (IlvA) (PDB:3IAU) [Commensalibacter communis]CAI3941493.1 Threonine deaminase (IlvA) (PDB:3IAU) [Commensalibacter communis]CAI3944646.1 Threonine deaminase (IlvA) (PDB:3IAU) [Commensalibacter communis]CAI3945151.1 Threonine deaminase (IlvA) (PDB:3IAU) [Commensalibacter communis]CAI3945221.1 Threonine deaminase (IlvA) (PDB:3IAU) [Commensalibacter communis]